MVASKLMRPSPSKEKDYLNENEPREKMPMSTGHTGYHYQHRISENVTIKYSDSPQAL